MPCALNKLLPAALGLMLMIGLVGCNTMEGAGQDMQDAGEAIEDEAS